MRLYGEVRVYDKLFSVEVPGKRDASKTDAAGGGEAAEGGEDEEGEEDEARRCRLTSG